MNPKDQRLWLDLDKVHKIMARAKWHYVGTEDKEIIEDLVRYVKILKKRLSYLKRLILMFISEVHYLKRLLLEINFKIILIF